MWLLQSQLHLHYLSVKSQSTIRCDRFETFMHQNRDTLTMVARQTRPATHMNAFTNQRVATHVQRPHAEASPAASPPNNHLRVISIERQTTFHMRCCMIRRKLVNVNGSGSATLVTPVDTRLTGCNNQTKQNHINHPRIASGNQCCMPSYQLRHTSHGLRSLHGRKQGLLPNGLPVEGQTGYF